MDERIYIYKITNNINRKVYIGQTKDVPQRWITHCKPSTSQKEYANQLTIDIQKYGRENFTLEIIDDCEEKHKFIIEKHYTELLSQDYELYNKNKGANFSDDSVNKIKSSREKSDFDYKSENFKNTISSLTSGVKNGMYNKKDDNAVNGKMVYMYDLDRNLLKTFVSVKSALLFLGLKGHSKLIEACKNETEYKGYYWKKIWKR